MTGNQGQEAILTRQRQKEPSTATRFKCNHNWSYRGDNTKYRDKK